MGRKYTKQIHHCNFINWIKTKTMRKIQYNLVYFDDFMDLWFFFFQKMYKLRKLISCSGITRSFIVWLYDSFIPPTVYRSVSQTTIRIFIQIKWSRKTKILKKSFEMTDNGPMCWRTFHIFTLHLHFDVRSKTDWLTSCQKTDFEYLQISYN